MGLLQKLAGIKNPADIIGATGKALDGLFTSKEEKLTHQEIMARIEQEPDRWQFQLNLAEAGHRSIFVAGWRPFIGWVCGFGLLFPFIVNPIIQWWTGDPGPVLPVEDVTKLVYALLGLGTLRTWEKSQGVSK